MAEAPILWSLDSSLEPLRPPFPICSQADRCPSQQGRRSRGAVCYRPGVWGSTNSCRDLRFKTWRRFLTQGDLEVCHEEGEPPRGKHRQSAQRDKECHIFTGRSQSPSTRGHQGHVRSRVNIKVRFIWLPWQGEHTLGKPEEAFGRRDTGRAPYGGLGSRLVLDHSEDGRGKRSPVQNGCRWEAEQFSHVRLQWFLSLRCKD